MKSFLLFIFIVAFFGNVAHAIISTNYSNSMNFDGTMAYYDRVFVQVLNGDSTNELVKGAAVILDTTADNGMTVIPSPISKSNFPVYCITAETIAVGKVGKCQVYGYSDTILFEGTVDAVAGEAIYAGAPGASAGRVRAIASGNVAAYDKPIGVFLDASTDDGAIEGFINLL